MSEETNKSQDSVALEIETLRAENKKLLEQNALHHQIEEIETLRAENKKLLEQNALFHQLESLRAEKESLLDQLAMSQDANDDDGEDIYDYVKRAPIYAIGMEKNVACIVFIDDDERESDNHFCADADDVCGMISQAIQVRYNFYKQMLAADKKQQPCIG